MKDWISRLFIERSDLFLILLNQRWTRTEGLVAGMIRLLETYGKKSGDLLDLCCGNGRISVFMAKRGFNALGVDISEAFLKDGSRKAQEHGVSDRVTFLKGDVRKLEQIVQKNQPFDVVTSAWTSIGYYSPDEDLNVFKQARHLSREGAVLFITETMHTEYLSIKFAPTSYSEIDDLVLLEDIQYDPVSACANTSWTFYAKRGKNLEFIDKVDFENHVYSASELSSLLRKAGWRTTALYGNIETLQPMSPLTSMNLVARAE
jgi:SAM-dependent methyltransferase